MSRLGRWFGGRAGKESDGLEQIGAVAANPEAERRAMLLRFESLGHNCELGFVQQKFDVNPLGLFRWSGISLDDLVRALDSDLAGIGDPESTEVGVNPAINEYYVCDTRYGMSTHTHVFADQNSAENVLKTFCARARRLREKLIEDLQEGRKIFVFLSGGPLADADLSRLHQAVRRVGPSAELLHVRPAAGETLGAVERARPGLLLGYIDQPGATDHGWVISYDLWLQIMRNAVAAVDGYSSGPHQPGR